jgi:hypothetical protein
MFEASGGAPITWLWAEAPLAHANNDKEKQATTLTRVPMMSTHSFKTNLRWLMATIACPALIWESTGLTGNHLVAYYPDYG